MFHVINNIINNNNKYNIKSHFHCLLSLSTGLEGGVTEEDFPVFFDRRDNLLAVLFIGLSSTLSPSERFKKNGYRKENKILKSIDKMIKRLKFS